MDENPSGFEPDNDPGIGLDLYLPQEQPPLVPLESDTTSDSHPHTSLSSDPQQSLVPVFHHPPPGLPLAPSTASPTDLGTPSTILNPYDPNIPLVFPSTIPDGSDNVSHRLWINDGSGSDDAPLPIHSSQEFLPGLYSNSPPAWSDPPIDSDLIEFLSLSNIFLPSANQLPFLLNSRSPSEVPVPSSPGYSGHPPALSHVPFTIRPPSVPIIDLPSSSSSSTAPGAQTSHPRRRRPSRKRKAPAEDDHDDDQPGSSSLISPIIESRRQRADHPPIPGYSVMELKLDGPSQSSATDLEGTSMMGRVSLPPVDDATPRCLHDNKTRKQPRHWQYHCEYNPNRRRIRCKDPKCNDTFSGKWNMERHFRKFHGSGSGDE